MREPGGHLPSLDGLRAVAVSGVVVFHVGQGRVEPDSSAVARLLFGATEYGSWGVDLFFVLSGFLITGILLDTSGKPGYFRSFYARRLLRIFPLYYLYLVLLAVALALIPAAHLASAAYARGWPWYALYLTNVKLAYFFDFDPGSVQHLWSLAIEEHFYLVWPAVVALLPRRMLLPFVLVAIASTVVARGWWLARGADPYVVHVSTWTRIDALLIGAALAIARLDTSAWTRFVRGVPLVAVGALGAAVLVPAGARYAAIALFFAAVLALCVAADERRRALPVLRSSVLRRIGELSYGVYVFHFFFVLSLSPLVNSVCGTQLLGFGVALLVIVLVTWACAELSYRWVETPALALKRHVPRPK